MANEMCKTCAFVDNFNGKYVCGHKDLVTFNRSMNPVACMPCWKKNTFGYSLREELVGFFSDMYKDRNGIRPRGYDIWDMPIAELQQLADSVR